MRNALRSFRALASDLSTILVRRRGDGRRRSIGGAIGGLRAYGAVMRADRAGQEPRAVRLAIDLLAVHPGLRRPLRIVSAGAARSGEPRAALAATRDLRRHVDSAALRRREADLDGRLRETDPGWLPEIDVPPGPVAPPAPSPDVVMHLLKASLPDRQSGYTIRSREVLRAQVDAGFRPFVVTPFGFPADREPRAPDHETVDGVVHHRIGPGEPTLDVPSDRLLSRTATAAAALALDQRPALVHVASGHRGYEYGLVGLALRERLGVPLVYEVRGFFETSWASEAIERDPEVDLATAELTRRRLATEARILSTADAVVTLGEAMRDELIAQGTPAERITVVPNGFDPAVFTPTAPDPELRARYGLAGRWVVGYISNMDHEREGQAVLIEATARLVADGRDVACLLVGEGRLRPVLEAAAVTAGIAERVTFTGRVPHAEVPAHHALLDAFVVPRLGDRAARLVTPLKPFEAMAMGVPLIVSDLPALTEIAPPDERGLVVTPGDVDALAAACASLMDHPDLGRRLAETAGAWVLAERTWASNGSRYRDLYRSILAD